ncbi:putative acetylglutamate kinase, chloroplastic-like isoform X1 [Capsicum annuum]|nr:putative acetylglutamate kinase, chloroplastic-like isoform X1 [Capsicum annuum]
MEAIHPTVGEYKLTCKLGGGSSSTVWKAEHRKTGKVVALKQIDRFNLTRQLKNCLDCELTFLSSVQHPNIIRLFNVFEAENSVFLVLEFCAGGDLASYIHNHGRVQECVARKFMKQIVAAGLEVLSMHQIIHRDLKPEVDMWSLGAILFELLNGYPPFRGSSSVQVRGFVYCMICIPFLPPLNLTNLLVPAENRISFEEFFQHDFLKLSFVDACKVLGPKSENEVFKTTKWPFPTIEDEDVLQPSALLLFLGNEILLLCMAANFRHLPAILMNFLALRIAILLGRLDTRKSPPPCILFSRDHDISQLLELEPHCNDYSSRLHNRPILLSCPEFNTLVKRRMDILVEDYPVLRLIGSCNGFIGFMTNIYDINASIYISDPLLGEYFKLILSELEKSVCRVAYGFCFSEVSGRYKLVRSVTKSFGGHLEVSELEVCILGVDEKWRNWGQVPYPVWQDFGQVCVNGALHWMDPINKDNIYSFDIKTEKLKSVPGSPGLVFPFKHLTQAELVRSRRPPSGLTLVELVNCLCLTDDGGSSFGIYGGPSGLTLVELVNCLCLTDDGGSSFGIYGG